MQKSINIKLIKIAEVFCRKMQLNFYIVYIKINYFYYSLHNWIIINNILYTSM